MIYMRSDAFQLELAGRVSQLGNLTIFVKPMMCVNLGQVPPLCKVFDVMKMQNLLLSGFCKERFSSSMVVLPVIEHAG